MDREAMDEIKKHDIFSENDWNIIMGKSIEDPLLYIWDMCIDALNVLNKCQNLRIKSVKSTKFFIKFNIFNVDNNFESLKYNSDLIIELEKYLNVTLEECKSRKQIIKFIYNKFKEIQKNIDLNTLKNIFYVIKGCLALETIDEYNYDQKMSEISCKIKNIQYIPNVDYNNIEIEIKNKTKNIYEELNRKPI